MMVDQTVGKTAVVHLPVVKSHEVERGLLAAAGVGLVLLEHRTETLVEAWKGFVDWKRQRKWELSKECFSGQSWVG